MALEDQGKMKHQKVGNVTGFNHMMFGCCNIQRIKINPIKEGQENHRGT